MSSDLECPVIHRVTDPSDGSAGAAEKSDKKCPVDHHGAAYKAQHKESEDINEGIVGVEELTGDPSLEEYKRLRRVMGMITKFYENGTMMKRGHYEDVTKEIEKLDEDQKMAKDQLAVLDKQDAFKRHPKVQQYKKNLQDEIAARDQQRKSMVDKQEEFLKLSEWSKVIVEVCQWLEANMEDYCINHLKLPLKGIRPAPVHLSESRRQEFAKGLAEIVYNLDESQDFFQASLDGRLQKYHNVERAAIMAQLEVIRAYSEMNPRRMHIEEELLKDLEYVEANMNETDESHKRKEKMLANHKEFLKVLMFYREKVGLKPENEVKFDSKYDHIQ